jgi:cytochrome c5
MMAAPVSVHAASGEAVYKATCNVCHDSGAGNAPRLTNRDDWAPRWQRGRAAMHDGGIKGVPNSAMGPKGGFANLSDDDVKAAVDYILARTGYQESLVHKPVATTTPAAPASSAIVATQLQVSNAPVDDKVLLQQLADALRKELAPGAPIENVDGKLLVRGVNIRVSVRDAVVTLEGTPEKPDVIARAERIAKSFRSVQRVDNRLVAAGLLDFD